MTSARTLPLIDYRRIIDALPDAVIAADAGNRVVFANAAAHSLFTAGQDELEGRRLVELMPDRMRPLHEAAFSRYFTTWEPHLLGRTIEVPVLRFDGQEERVEMTLNPGASEEGDLLVVAVMRPARAAHRVDPSPPARH